MSGHQNTAVTVGLQRTSFVRHVALCTLCLNEYRLSQTDPRDALPRCIHKDGRLV